MRLRIGIVLCLAAMGFLRQAVAADAYLVRFDVQQLVPGTCNLLRWHDHIIVFNRGTTPAVVKILGNSDGPPLLRTPDSFVVAPKRSLSVDEALGNAWAPASQADFATPYPLYVLHVDVPDNVSIQSNDDIEYKNGCLSFGRSLDSVGHVSFPVFSRLAEAGSVQVHLGTDLGTRSSRTNVGIYNAGDREATAHIELRRGCDDSIADSRTVLIPPDRTVQIGGLVGGVDTKCGVGQFAYWMRYTTVSVDQPSLSFVTTIATDDGFRVSGIPIVNVSVAHGRDF